MPVRVQASGPSSQCRRARIGERDSRIRLPARARHWHFARWPVDGALWLAPRVYAFWTAFGIVAVALAPDEGRRGAAWNRGTLAPGACDGTDLEATGAVGRGRGSLRLELHLLLHIVVAAVLSHPGARFHAVVDGRGGFMGLPPQRGRRARDGRSAGSLD